jgi:DnaJ family protein C protein 28
MSASRPTEPDHDAEQPASTPRQALSMRTYYTVLDQRIAAAQAEGAFDNLPGAGKPFQFGDDALVPEDERVGYRLLKSNGFAPGWIELQKTIHADRAMLESWLKHANNRWPRLNARERQRLQEEHKKKVTELNRLIFNYTLTAPKAASQQMQLRVEEELARLGS